MSDPPFQTVSKLDAAERQLGEAARLFFERRDMIAVHTLVGAAHTVLRDIGRNSNVKSIIKDLAPIKPEKREEFQGLINAAQNFFKHADRDTDETFDFYYDGTKFYMLDAIEMLFKLRHSLPKELFIFRTWLYLNYPQFFLDSATQEMLGSLGGMLGNDLNDFPLILEALRSPLLPERYGPGAT